MHSKRPSLSKQGTKRRLRPRVLIPGKWLSRKRNQTTERKEMAVAKPLHTGWQPTGPEQEANRKCCRRGDLENWGCRVCCGAGSGLIWSQNCNQPNPIWSLPLETRLSFIPLFFHFRIHFQHPPYHKWSGIGRKAHIAFPWRGYICCDLWKMIKLNTMIELGVRVGAKEARAPNPACVGEEAAYPVLEMIWKSDC